jgi:hypothetical protein
MRLSLKKRTALAARASSAFRLSRDHPAFGPLERKSLEIEVGTKVKRVAKIDDLRYSSNFLKTGSSELGDAGAIVSTTYSAGCTTTRP